MASDLGAPPFQLPDYEPGAVLFAGIAVYALWLALKRRDIEVFTTMPLTAIPRGVLWYFAFYFDLLLFVTVGVIVSVGVVQPSTPLQAIAAGLSWTGLLTRRKRDSEPDE